jgi:hypothetical protein
VLPNTQRFASTTGGKKVLVTTTSGELQDGLKKNTVPAKALFILTLVKMPGTAWLNDIVLKDENGFIVTGMGTGERKII